MSDQGWGDLGGWEPRRDDDPAPQGPFTPGGFQPQGPYGYTPYGYGPPPGPKPNNYLVPAIAATLLCCLPAGVAGIVFAAQVDSKWNAGDYDGAMQSAKNARTWTYVSFGVGLVLTTLYVVIMISTANTGTTYRY